MALSIATFENGSDLDEVFVDAVCVDIVRASDACYDIEIISTADERVRLKLWTSSKGVIETVVTDLRAVLGSEPGVAEDGTLLSFRAEQCTAHLEHMSRGHYWLGLSREDRATGNIDFTTRGYLKCVFWPSDRNAMSAAPQRRKMMQAWADHLEGLRKTSIYAKSLGT